MVLFNLKRFTSSFRSKMFAGNPEKISRTDALLTAQGSVSIGGGKGFVVEKNASGYFTRYNYEVMGVVDIYEISF